MRIPVPVPPEGLYVVLNWARTGIKGIPVFNIAHNNWWQKLRLFEDFIETTVIFPSRSHISEIESIELSETIFNNLSLRINWKDNLLTFDCAPENEEDTLDVIRYFQRKGVALNEMAQHIIELNNDR